jgi:molecular chaperone GrpE
LLLKYFTSLQVLIFYAVDLASGGFMGEKKGRKTLSDLKKELKEKNTQIEGYKTRIKYLQADFENYQKRVARERETLKRLAKEDLILRLLDVYENLERGVNNGHQTKKKDLLKGLEMTYKQLKKILKDEGVEEIEALGKKFDPFLHEALVKESRAGCGKGIILEEYQRGYKLRDKVIRYSKVKVSER